MVNPIQIIQKTQEPAAAILQCLSKDFKTSRRKLDLPKISIFINSIKIGYWTKRKATKTMRITTILIVVITVLLTVVLMQNTESVRFDILFGSFYISKLAALGTFGLTAFILGILVGRPKKARSIADKDEDDDYIGKKSNTLSDEDREYISNP